MRIRHRKWRAGIFCMVMVFSGATAAAAAVLDVCASGCAYTTIQSAIDAAVTGDTVLVQDGTYVERIDFKGKAVIVRSVNGPGATTIDGNKQGSVVSFNSGEGSGSVLEGFTITNGSSAFGGGIYCNASSPAISNCIVSGNSASAYGGGICCFQSSPAISNCAISGNSASSSGGYGGGIYCWESSPAISSCTISGNSSDAGGGIYCISSSPTISSCTISGNSAPSTYGGGIFCYQSTPAISNCTISGNYAGAEGGGIYCDYYSYPTISNCTIGSNYTNIGGGGICIQNGSNVAVVNSIFWGNVAPWGEGYQVYVGGGSFTAAYSDFQGGWPGTGNIDRDPLFVDPRPPSDIPNSAGDYRLQAASPCIDKGTGDPAAYPRIPAYDLSGDPRPQGAGYDMGSDEFALLSNGSFEEGSGLIPSPWVGKNFSGRDGRDTGTSHGGRASFRMVGGAATRQLRQELNMPGSAGDVFDLSCWHKADQPSALGGFFGVNLTFTYTDQSKKTYQLAFPRTTHDWKEGRKTFTAQKDYTWVGVSLVYAGQTGKAWFDDVRLSIGVIPRWERTYNGADNYRDAGRSVAVAPDGSICVVGSVGTILESDNLLLRKYSPSGALLWSRTYKGPDNDIDIGNDVAVASDGSIYVTGYTRVDLQGDNLLLRKYSPSGKPLWTRTYNGKANDTEYGNGVAVAPDGSVYVTGITRTATSLDLLLRKYSPSGDLLWARTYNGADNGSEFGADVAVASNGSVYVAGSTFVTSQSHNLMLQKYSPSGNLLWTRTYDGPASQSDWAENVTVATDGSIFAAGGITVSGEGWNLILQKYSPSGVLYWTSTYNGSANGNDFADGLAAAPGGGVFVVGATDAGPESDNLLLQQYSPSGDLRYTRTYNGAGNANDYGDGVAVAPDGSVYVAGSTEVAQQGSNLLLLKYK